MAPWCHIESNEKELFEKRLKNSPRVKEKVSINKIYESGMLIIN